MAKSSSLGQFEQIVLTAILSLGDNAYGITIHKRVQELSKPKSVMLGAVYVTLDRMEDKRLVSSVLSDPTPERGGRAKRCYRVEPSGTRALQESAEAARRLWDAWTEIWGEAPAGKLGRKWGRAIR